MPLWQPKKRHAAKKCSLFFAGVGDTVSTYTTKHDLDRRLPEHLLPCFPCCRDAKDGVATPHRSPWINSLETSVLLEFATILDGFVRPTRTETIHPPRPNQRQGLVEPNWHSLLKKIPYHRSWTKRGCISYTKFHLEIDHSLKLGGSVRKFDVVVRRQIQTQERLVQRKA